MNNSEDRTNLLESLIILWIEIVQSLDDFSFFNLISGFFWAGITLNRSTGKNREPGQILNQHSERLETKYDRSLFGDVQCCIDLTNLNLQSIANELFKATSVI